jgi:uncharacterized membrane protein
MRFLNTLLLGCLGAAVLVTSATAATVVPVPDVANSKKTTAFAINDYDVVAGSFIDKNGLEHAFFGTLDGNYTTFDGGTGGTEARGINNAGYISGFSNSLSGVTSDQTMFVRKPSGKLLTVDGFSGRAQGINNTNHFAGTFWDFTDFEAVAFVGHHAEFKHEVRIPAVHQASGANGINDNGDVVGSFFQPPDHGFIVSNHTLTIVDYPSAHSAGTTLEGINASGQAVGQWFGNKGRVRSFLYDIATNTFTDIDVPGAKKVQAWAINNAGAVAVSTSIGSFVWCASDTSCPGGGNAVKAAQHVAAKPFPHFACGRTCEIPAADIKLHHHS